MGQRVAVAVTDFRIGCISKAGRALLDFCGSKRADHCRFFSVVSEFWRDVVCRCVQEACLHDENGAEMDETIAGAGSLGRVDSLPCGLVRSAGLGRAATLGGLDRPAMRRGGLQAKSCAYTPPWLRQPVTQVTLVGTTARTLDQTTRMLFP